ncbi:MAG TPA: hypothetical protein VFV72_01000 [Candidatus Limnocylindrales bacterium]|nr:hypothetical protein [Candidatus Limnocylindrales bacterium]
MKLPSAIWGLVKRNPVRAQALVQAVIGVATAFGLGWTAQQVGAVMILSAGLLAFLTETAVTPVAAPVIPEGTTVTVTTPAGEDDRTVTVS